jgi:4-oxalocrotonate tautomerase
MPVITVSMGAASEEKKQALIERLTAEAVSITDIKAEAFTVLINEYPLENMGWGGKTAKANISSVK